MSRERLADPQAVLVLDETGFVKKGAKSVGVAPQYCGAVGKIANCQIGVFLAYATAAGPVLLDRDALPAQGVGGGWARREEAGVPAEVTARPKPALGQALLERAFAAGRPGRWVTADSVYGGRLRAAPLPRGAGAALRAGGAEHPARSA